MTKHISINQARQPYGDISILTPYGFNRVKKYNGKDIFLDNGTEFVIELDNPTSHQYLVKIKLNGKYISSSGLILRPGEHTYLERYIDTDRRFRFETYNIPADRKDLVEKNGVVEIEFYEEYFSYQFFSWSYPYTVEYYPLYWTTGVGGTGSTTTHNGITNYCYSSWCSSQIVDNADTGGQKETGRVEEGSKSNQNFRTAYGCFNSYYSYKNEFKLWPASQKQAVVQYEIRSYCSGCGRRKRSGENFCPKCGNKL